MPERKMSLEKLLSSHPELRQRVESLIDIIYDTRGELDRADDAEERVVGELRQLGQEIMENWAKEKEAQKVSELQTNKDEKVIKHGKKSPLVHDLWRSRAVGTLFFSRGKTAAFLFPWGTDKEQELFLVAATTDYGFRSRCCFWED